MNNENIEIDVNAFEEARYQDILKSGKYAELKILVGTQSETIGGKTGVIPCVKLKLHNVDSATISVLYSSLLSFQQHLKMEYPIECMVSTLMNDVKEIGSWEVTGEQNNKTEKE